MRVVPGSVHLPVKFTIKVIVTGAAFAGLALFYGAQVNLVFLAGAVTALLILALSQIRSHCPGIREVLFIVIAAAAICGSQLHSLSPEGSFPAAWVLALVPVSYVLGRCLQDQLPGIWMVLGALLGVVVIYSFVELGLHGVRPGLPLTDYNNFAAVLYVFVLPLAYRLMITQAERVRSAGWWIGLLFVFLASTLIAATGSRAATWIVLAGVLCLAAIACRETGRTNLIVIVPVAAWMGWLTFKVVFDQTDTSLQSAETLAGGLGVRLTLIESAWATQPDNLLLGTGLLTFPLLYRQIRGAEDPDTAGLFIHNDYVQLLVETGVPGLLPLFALLVLVVSRLVTAMRSGKTAAASGGDAGYAVALAGLLVHALVNFVFYTAVLGFLAGLLAASIVNCSRASQPPAAVAWYLLVPPVLLAVIALGHLWIDVTTAAVLQGQPGNTWTRNIAADPERQLRFARKFQELNPSRGTPVVGEAVLLSRLLARTADASDVRRALDV